MSKVLEKVEYQHIEILYPGCPTTSQANRLCAVGQDLTIDYKKLERFCFRPLPPEGLDLIILTGAVVFADRKIKRVLNEGWARHIRLTIPVQSTVWFQQAVSQKLVEVLHFLSGDCWEIEFIPAPKGTLPDIGQMFIPLLNPEEEHVILPYSDGLDSFAAGRLISLSYPDVNPILITTQNSGVSSINNIPKDVRQARIPVSIQGDTAEDSYRTRTFLFKTLAALAAYLSNSTRIIIPENGQGSIGPSLIPFFSEWPHRSSHPLFTLKLADFLKTVLGREFIFEHPYKWNTKGQVLTQLRKAGLQDGWESTYSCVYGPRHSSLRGRRVNCGVCSGCLLRRMSLFTAGIDSSIEEYLFPSFDIESSSNRFKKSFNNVANSGALAMQELAEFSPNSNTFLRAAHEMSMYFEEEFATVKEALSGLINNHATEWKAFVQVHGDDTFLSKYR